MEVFNRIGRFLDRAFSPNFKRRFEQLIIYMALVGFILHLGLIFWVHWQGIPMDDRPELLRSPIDALYTPFSFILIQEVFLLVYYLPQSFTTSIAKQYEIISLIIIRRIFKDVSKLDLKEWTWNDPLSQQLMVDMSGALLLFFLVFLFYKLYRRRPAVSDPQRTRSFINFKKGVSLLLIPIMVGLVFYSFVNWAMSPATFSAGFLREIKDINNIFYNEFFTLLVLVDVFILILSLRYTDNYAQLMRNSGFVISTVLIRFSFIAGPVVNTALVIAGVGFGVLIMWIYNQYDGINPEQVTEEV